MLSKTYICNGCQRVLEFDYYPPVGNLSIGFTCPACSELAKEIATEVETGLARCGKDGKMTKDYYTYKLTPDQLALKYGCTVEEALRRVELCANYISGKNRKDISYDDWVRSQT